DFHLQSRTAASAAVEAVVIGPQRGSCHPPGLLGSQQDGIISEGHGLDLIDSCRPVTVPPVQC
ncbi:hypothetical protein ASPCADRAFT_203313, partial [Aspergillus carbonarius ITEM 5010]